MGRGTAKILGEMTQSKEGPTRRMELSNKTAAEQLADERDLVKRLRAWYIAPGRQRDLLKSENEAFQAVIRLLEQRTRLKKR
jgi:hypothetical protein